MADLEFHKDPKRKTNPVPETRINKPKNTFNPDEITAEAKTVTQKKKMGRPRKNKVYGTLRLQKKNVFRLNALQNALAYESQDDLEGAMLTQFENSLSNEQRVTYDYFLKTYIDREQRKKQS